MAKKNKKENNKLNSQMTSMAEKVKTVETSKTGLWEMMPNTKEIMKNNI